MPSLPDWARAYGEPLCACTIRSTPSDFVVTEQLEVEFSGDGEHDWLLVRKTGANTAWVAGKLARHAAVPERDVGYAGLKDRHAVTTQWFSVRRPSADGTDWQSLSIEGVELLAVKRHSRKLKRGAHRGNAFRIALRGEDLSTKQEVVEQRARQIAVGGVPNYFGEQRFGRDGSNIQLGEAVLAGRRMARNKRSIGISALRSLHFNNELSERVADGTWNRVSPGETANLDGSNSVFDVEEVTPEIEERCNRMDIHPTGELPGNDAIGVKASRRPLRMRVVELQWESAGNAVWLEFTLGSGGFATAVLREIVRYAAESGRSA